MTRALVRWMGLLGGAVVLTVCFVALLERDIQPVLASPWWIFGLAGLGLVVIALGSPRASRESIDASPDAEE